MHLSRTIGFALLAFTGLVGTASAATYTWPLVISVPVTLSISNWPPGDQAQFTCSPVKGAGTSQILTLKVQNGTASYNASVTLNLQGSGQPMQSGNPITCNINILNSSGMPDTTISPTHFTSGSFQLP
jgi:hypothetical protein